jgi:hypothetical protein
MPKKSRISPALARIAERGMTISEEEIRMFQPGETELLISEAMLGGALTFKEIAESIKRSPALVSEKLKDGVFCAWCARAVHQQIHTRLGMLDAAMYRRALGGDVRAYEALMKRYGKSADLKVVAHIGSENFDLMSDSALNALLERHKKGIIDVPEKSRDVRDEAPTAQDGDAEVEDARPLEVRPDSVEPVERQRTPDPGPDEPSRDVGEAGRSGGAV